MISNLLLLIGFILAFVAHYGNARTFSPAPSGGGWESISMSSDGKYIHVVDVNGLYGILSSSDYGSSWTSPADGTMGIWYQVHTSGNGQYVSGIRDSNNWISSNYGSSYKGATTSCYSVGMSRSGQYLVTPVYSSAVDGKPPKAVKVSNNYGASFHEVAGTELSEARGAGISGSGQYMVAANYSTVLLSSDYGSTFTALNLPTNYYWGPFEMNYDGKYMLFSSTKEYYYSNDYGKTFAPSTFPKGQTAFSETGEYVVVSVSNVGVYISRDYGATWELTSAPAKAWSDITISANGQRIAVCEYRGVIYQSADYGKTWGITATVDK